MNRGIWTIWALVMALLAMGAAAGCVGDDDDDDDSGGGGDDDDDDDDDDDVEGVECENNLCILTGVISEDYTMKAENEYLLSGGVFIGDDTNETVLTIEPGTRIYGESSTNGLLVVTRGSKIMAEGTADAPIVFSSSKVDGERARGDWGGIIINGRAPINNCLVEDTTEFCESIGEGGTGKYGGTDAGDSSGVLKYVRVEFAGNIISPDNELNGIAFQGVGSGTEVDYVHVHMNKDDGVEFFGGTVNAKHIIVTGVADDMLDWTDGWTGKVQFAVLQQYADGGDNGFEGDNNGEDNTATPRSHPTISNVTIIGVPGGEFSDLGMLIREGTAGNFSNIIIDGFAEGCIQIEHDETFNVAADGADLSGELTLTNSILHCDTVAVEPAEAADPDFTVADFVNTLNADNSTDDPMLSDAFNTSSPDFTPSGSSPALGAGVAPGDSFFDAADFIGGVGADDWTSWTAYPAS
ncbi:MAG: hypothetical protein KJ042_12845 [Deltaproteobacteria bacterium]|nr:hypothetical protein [Deltaproteobacteria bacterium]